MLPLLAMAGLGIIKSGLSLDASQKASDMQRLQTLEEWRRLRRQQLNVEGQAAAVGAASGVDTQSEGLQAVLADMDAEHARQAQWMRDAGMEAANATEKAGILKFVGDLGQTFFSTGQSMNWFKTPSTGG